MRELHSKWLASNQLAHDLPVGDVGVEQGSWAPVAEGEDEELFLHLPDAVEPMEPDRMPEVVFGGGEGSVHLRFPTAVKVRRGFPGREPDDHEADAGSRGVAASRSGFSGVGSRFVASACVLSPTAVLETSSLERSPSPVGRTARRTARRKVVAPSRAVWGLKGGEGSSVPGEGAGRAQGRRVGDSARSVRVGAVQPAKPSSSRRPNQAAASRSGAARAARSFERRASSSAKRGSLSTRSISRASPSASPGGNRPPRTNRKRLPPAAA